MRIVHPVYGRGTVVRAAQGPFRYVAFDNPRNERMAVLAVIINVCWRQ